jgi:hypothetical protein
VFFVAPVRFRSAMSAGAVIVLDVLLALRELIKQEPGCQIVISVWRGPFLVLVLPCAQIATLGLSLP